MQHRSPLPDFYGANTKSQRGENEKPTIKRSFADPTAQKTISELFGSSKHTSYSEDTASTVLTPSKRLKLSHNCIKNDEVQPRTIGPDNMYNFSSTSPKSNGVIDLTGSPDGSPGKGAFMQRRMSGAVRPAHFTPHMGAKKLVVKNFRRTSKANPDQYYEHVWGQLDVALSAIFRGEKPPYSLEELYRGVENICRQEKAPDLYQRLSEKCKENVLSRLRSLVGNATDNSDISVLRSAVMAWTTWRNQLNTIRSIFYYMDRSYLLHSTSQPTIEEMGISQFRTCIFSDPTIKDKIVEGTIEFISQDRLGEGKCFDDSLFESAIKMFHVLMVYTKEVEPRIMGESTRFYDRWATERSSKNSLVDYVENCHNLINREMLRCDQFKLDSSTRTYLNDHLETYLIEYHQADLVHGRSVFDLLEHGSLVSLQRLYELLQRKGLGEKLRPSFETYINTQGSAIVFDEEREDEMAPRLLQFKKKLDTIWEFSFSKHEGLGHSLRHAFETFINQTKKTNMTWGTDNPKPGEMIAKYVDMILRGGMKAIPKKPLAPGNDPNVLNEDEDISEEDVDASISKQLDQVLDMFRFVHGKAVFEAFYKRDLARRLLMGRSASADAEKSMLTRLKSECGAGFTHNLEQMFTDIELAREEITSYKQMLEERQKKSPVDLNVNVLSASAWPTYGDVAVEIPRDIQKATSDFEEYYRSKHGGRKLAWKHALAHCQLRANLPKGNKEIIVSSFQAIVMLYFNEKPANEPVSYSDIQAATNLRHEELERTLQSLACAKYRILSKSPKGKDINHTDTFTINLNFTDPKYRIKINQIQLKETKEENKETHERVAADRHYETQAAIVRIMKSRKTIKHAELVAEVITATKSRGVLDPVDIKKNIEKLIEKDYMEREEGNTYSYLA